MSTPSGIVYGYDPLPTTLGGEFIFGYDATTVFTFDRAYILSLPGPVQALHVGEVGQYQIINGQKSPSVALDPATRMALAMSLAKQGYFIDAWVDAYGADPFMTMKARLIEGVLSVQTAIGTATKVVSINPADYPAWVPPPAPPAPTNTELLGAPEFANFFLVTPFAMTLFNGGELKSGDSITENGHTYKFVVVPLAVGFGYFWQQTN